MILNNNENVNDIDENKLINFATNEDRKKFFAYYNEFKKYSVLSSGGKTVINERLLNSYRDNEIDVTSFHLLHAEKKFNKNSSDKFGRPFIETVKFSKWFLESEKTKRYEYTVFSPLNNQKPNEYNKWKGFIAPQNGDIKLFKQYIDNTIDESEEVKEHLIKLLAYSIQYPSKLMEVALAFIGPQGCGKTTIAETLLRICPAHTNYIRDLDLFFSGFNEETIGLKYFIFDEVSWGGYKDLTNKLKAFITGTKRTVRIKGKSSIVMDNFALPIFVSNYNYVVQLDDDDRRFNIFSCKAFENSKAFFKTYYNWLDNENGASKILNYLLNYDLTGFVHNVVIDTKQKATTKLEGFNGVDKFIYEILTNHVEELLLDDVEKRINRSVLYELYKKSDNNKYLENKNNFAKKIASVFNYPERWADNWKDRALNYYYKFPTKKEAMELFAKSKNTLPQNIFECYEDLSSVTEEEILKKLQERKDVKK